MCEEHGTIDCDLCGKTFPYDTACEGRHDTVICPECKAKEDAPTTLRIPYGLLCDIRGYLADELELYDSDDPDDVQARDYIRSLIRGLNDGIVAQP